MMYVKRLRWSIIATLALILVAIFALSSNVNQTEDTHPQHISEFVPFELLAPVDDEDHANFLSMAYNMFLEDVSQYGIARFTVSEESHYHDIIKNNTDNIQGNAIYRSTRPPRPSTNDPYLSYQYAIPMMKVDLAWSHTQGISEVVVAIIDTGIDINHVEFENRISPYSYNSRLKLVGLQNVIDDYGHGTQVAGVIAAAKDNGVGIAGIAPNITLLAIKANDNGADTFYDSAVIEGIYYAIEQAVDVINLSLGGYNQNNLMKTAIDQAADNGIIVVGAAGNDGISDPVYPASYDNVISVSSLTSNKTIASYSNYGATIDLSAPGTSIYTTGLNNTYVSVSGTSLAAPQVTGVVALIKSFDTTLSRDEILLRLFATAIDEGEPGKDDYYGYGIVNAYHSLDLLTFFVQFLDADDFLLYEDEVSYGYAAYPPNDPIKEDTVSHYYEFVAWDTDYSFVTDHLIVRPIFLSYIKQYTYTFYDEDNTMIQLVTADYGSQIVFPNNPTKASNAEYTYVFSDWLSEVGQGDILMGNVDFYATYIATVNQYTYTFYAEDGLTILKQTTSDYGSHIEAPIPPEKEESQQYYYVFTSWDKPFDTLVADITLYPMYQAITQTYTVTFVIGEETTMQTVAYGDDAIFPEGEAVSDVVDWSDDGTFITSDRAIIALLSSDMYTLSFYVDDNLLIEHTLLVTDSIQDIPFVPFKEGHNGHWSLDDLQHMTTDTRIDAIYTPLIYAVTFMNGDEIVETIYVAYGQSTSIILLQKEGYLFQGWHDEEAPYDFSTSITSNTTLVAQWSQVQAPPHPYAVFGIIGFLVLFVLLLLAKR